MRRVLALLVSLLPLYAAATSSSPASEPRRGAYFSAVEIEPHASAGSPSDGDLWPSCWADDGNLYSANGDGRGFSLDGRPADIAVSRISGTPGSLTGTTVAAGDAVGQVWTAQHNRKPTGMACVDGAIYLAVQDLALDFDDAPAATIAKSTDHGRTWTWDRTAPMFDGSVFTTIMFLDYGRDNANAIDGYVYAYGLDHNWRDSFSGRVPDPVDVYLARVPRNAVQDRRAWQFFAGRQRWSHDVNQRVAVLHDATRVRDLTVISQGGVVYNKPLDRYLYTSWSEYTFEFYESPTPWGPWKRFASKDFGGYPWTLTEHGGYGTTIPSKFIGADGRSMWLQSNVCPCGGGGISVYNYSLRRLRLEPARR